MEIVVGGAVGAMLETAAAGLMVDAEAEGKICEVGFIFVRSSSRLENNAAVTEVLEPSSGGRAGLDGVDKEGTVKDVYGVFAVAVMEIMLLPRFLLI
jgi:hypothetical protein